MRITTFQWQVRVFTVKTYKIKNDMVECVASDGGDCSFPLKDVVWINKLRKTSRICYRIKQEISGVHIKSIGSAEIEGFSTALLPDGTKLLINRKLNTLYKKDPPNVSR